MSTEDAPKPTLVERMRLFRSVRVAFTVVYGPITHGMVTVTWRRRRMK